MKKMFLLNELHQYSEELDRMADEGVISRDEALNHPARHFLTSALMGEGNSFDGFAGGMLPSGSRRPSFGGQ